MLKRIKQLLSRRGSKAAAVTPPPEVESSPSAAPPPGIHRGPSVAHHPIPASDLDADAVRIIQRLTRFDHAAYLVGGCVRDLLLERKPKDFDIGTSATPRQVKRLFRNCRIIGRRFRLAHIYFQNGKIIEVATFRAQDGDEGPPSEEAGADLLIRDDNQFGTLEEDALRRDFTINSLFYDVANGNVLDHADGLGDLRRRVVRTIGDPTVRFKEDPIRILRAIRFAARLGFDIEERTLEALRRTREEIPRAAAPRILEEFNRVSRAGAGRRSFELLRETSVLEVVLPELARRFAEPRAWSLALELLGELDRRCVAGQDASTGQILSVLLVAALAEDLGWRAAGPAEPPPPAEAQRLVDAVLRPLAQRLRVSRKDQEHCRQLLATLGRLVEHEPARRGSRRALLRRPAVSDALWILGGLARALGGPWVATSQAWSRAAEGQPVAEAPAAARPHEAEGDEHAAARTGRRRRGRRGGRRGRRAPGDVPVPAPVAATVERPAAAAPGRKLPPVWDDDYFFAALPTAPALAPEEGGADRYGAARLAAAAGAPEKAPDPEPEAETPSAPADAHRPRRRRRRRGSGRSGRAAETATAPATEGAGGDDEPDRGESG